jgi:S-adenosylmethionine hydrolase
MADPIITLTTDFGESAPYVAAMKGVILGINPQARILDLSHQIPPQDVQHAAFFLQNAIPYFPPAVIHVVVVDPGVGTDRALLYVEVDGHRLLVPDNGCWTRLPCTDPSGRRVLRLTEAGYWRSPVSATFHGRDILAPVAGHLSLGVDARKLGVPVESWVQLDVASPELSLDRLRGEIAFVDQFGNLITNIPGEALQSMPVHRRLVHVGDRSILPVWVKTYAEAAAGTLVGLVSSAGMVEIAVNQGSAAERLGAGVGAAVELTVRGENG